MASGYFSVLLIEDVLANCGPAAIGVSWIPEELLLLIAIP